MINKFIKHVPLSKFDTDCSTYSKEKQNYDISYPEFVKYFADRETITKHELIIGINFIYGWMPTIFDFRSMKFDEAIIILNNAKKGIIPTLEELQLLKALFNNSLVGTTKLLHFINPELFAIWDSRVYRYLTGEEAYNHRIGDCTTYIVYLSFCNMLISRSEYVALHKTICDKMGYSMSKLRTAELIMYLNGGK